MRSKAIYLFLLIFLMTIIPACDRSPSNGIKTRKKQPISPKSERLTYQQLKAYAHETLQLPNGMNVNYRSQGNSKGRTILLIHGGGDSLGTWQQWAEKLQLGFQIITVDLPGHGLTDPTDIENDNTEYYGEFINSFVNQLNLDNFILVGHSYGGESALHYITRYPDKVKGLILIGSGGYRPDDFMESTKLLAALDDDTLRRYIESYTPSREEHAYGLQYCYYQQTALTEDTVNRGYNLSRYDKNIGHSVYLFVNACRNYRVVSNLDSISVPTLLLWGDQDYFFPIEKDAYQFKQDIADSKLIIYKNIGHFVQEEVPNESVIDVIQFIEDNQLN